MRRFAVSGLVPCEPVELADRLLDSAAAPQIWPQIRQQVPVATPGGWWECSVSLDEEESPSAESQVSKLRLRRTSETEIQERSDLGLTIHRFLPATGGCLWSIESHARRAPRESWPHFVRRRERERHRAMGLVDTAASYYASLL